MGNFDLEIMCILAIVVTLPFNKIEADDTDSLRITKERNENHLNATQNRILKELRNNPNITQSHLTSKLKISQSSVYKNLRYLKENGYIERRGSNKKRILGNS